MNILWFQLVFFFLKQKTAYEVRISDWSSDVCSSDRAVQRLSDPLCRGGHDGCQDRNETGTRLSLQKAGGVREPRGAQPDEPSPPPSERQAFPLLLARRVWPLSQRG